MIRRTGFVVRCFACIGLSIHGQDVFLARAVCVCFFAFAFWFLVVVTLCSYESSIKEITTTNSFIFSKNDNPISNKTHLHQRVNFYTHGIFCVCHLPPPSSRNAVCPCLLFWRWPGR